MAFAVCFAAVLAGDTMAFFFGRCFGRRVLASNLARRYFTPAPAAAHARLLPQVRQQGDAGRAVHARPALHDLLHRGDAARAARRCSSSTTSSAAAFSVPVLVYIAWFFGGQIDKVIVYARQTEHGILVAIV